MNRFLILFFLIAVISCKNSETKTTPIPKAPVQKEDSTALSAIATKDFREFKVLDSEFIRNKQLWELFEKDLENFTETKYNQLIPLVIDQDIPTLQQHIREGKLTYELLTKFYLYRIRKYDRENDLSLNSVIALNPNVIADAKQKDVEFKNKMMKHPVFGMPILLKDNIDVFGLPTTAGAAALRYNVTSGDAFIVEQLKNKGALILGKANLSEWAYFFCGDCPSGYSAIGGQTLNPYGRKIFDTGGSSSGSGVAVAANFCVAAIGSETAGSILSPASQNSVVGLKPTIGLLSRTGIVPISSTLDTPGPMTRNVMDNALVLDAMFGEDKMDAKSIWALWETGFYYKELKSGELKGKRFGAFKSLLKDTLYANAIAVLKKRGAVIVDIEEEETELPDFIRLLNLDMKKDLPVYLSRSTDSTFTITSVQDVMVFNDQDSVLRAPYGQNLFKGIVADHSTPEELDSIKAILHRNGKAFFDIPMDELKLNGILSINNYHAAEAAVAEYPAITVPMGYDAKGAPKGLTFIGKRLQEKFLLLYAYDYEQASKMRKSPENYK